MWRKSCHRWNQNDGITIGLRMKIFSKHQIQKALDLSKVIDCIEQGFVIYSSHKAMIPPVATLHFDNPPGDCHIKYGYAKEGKYYVIKVASGFHQNPLQGISAGNGMMLLFDKATGMPISILLDEGYLTDLRTAAAGAISAKYLTCIRIRGTRPPTPFQNPFLSFVTDCRNVMIWGRDPSKAEIFSKHPDLRDFKIHVVKDLNQLTAECNLIVTTTSSSSPLLSAHQIRTGTHITAVGADDIGKHELDPKIFLKADRIVVDSFNQCSLFGDTAHALKSGHIQKCQLLELGQIIIDPTLGRTSEHQITIADLTGVAIQDLQIAIAAYESLSA